MIAAVARWLGITQPRMTCNYCRQGYCVHKADGTCTTPGCSCKGVTKRKAYRR